MARFSVRIMALQYCLMGLGSHIIQFSCAGPHTVLHRLSQSIHIARRKQPTMLPMLHQLGNAATKVDSTGRRRAMASMMTTGKPSAKLGNTKARAANNSCRTCSALIQPVIRTCACKPCNAIKRSTSGRISPSPASTNSMNTPASRNCRTALNNNIWPFCSHSRPTHTKRGTAGTGTWATW